MTQLYKLTEQYNTIASMLDSEKYEYITRESINASLADIKDKLTDKMDSIAKLVLSLKADVAGIDPEIERLANRKKATNNTIEWLKLYLLSEMTAVGMQRVRKDVVTVSVADNPPSVDTVNMELLPEAYVRTIPEQHEPDKKAIIEHFKQTGEIVTGVELVLNKKHISIR